jgi:PAS domain S-box-containing protein
MVMKRDKDELYRLISENAGDVIWILDVEKGSFTYVSPSVQKLRGFTPEEVMKQSISDVLTEKSLLFIQINLPLRLKSFYEGDLSVRVMTHEMDQICKDGSVIHTEVVTTLLPDLSGKVTEILGVSRDITDRKLAEKEIARLTEELEKRIAERTRQLENINSELEAFTYSVSHDLRAPLRAINGFSNILLSDYSSSLDDEAKRLLSVIYSNVLKMDHLITDLLSLAKISRSSILMEKVDMNSLVKNVYEAISTPEEKQKISFIVNALPDARCDSVLMGQVWNNLISNAIKFSSPRINRKIEISGRKEEDTAFYEIRDNGVGFNPKYSHLLFDVFQRLHKMNEFEGTGVGLAIVKRIVQRHGGNVWAEGDEGFGAVFSFSLPG